MGEEDGKANHYEDYDYDELPEEVRKAANTLGYDKKMWDGDGKPPSENKDWEELTKEEREAAVSSNITMMYKQDRESASVV
jgi:hypothetical protein